MITVAVTNVSGRRLLSSAEFRRITASVCRKEKVRNAEFSFVVLGSREIRSINRKFLRHDYVTDVITFPLDQRRVQAEIYINGEIIERQANEHGVTRRNEMIRLVVHGTLHALGYDDTTPAMAKKMTIRQERYVAALSVKQ